MKIRDLSPEILFLYEIILNQLDPILDEETQKNVSYDLSRYLCADDESQKTLHKMRFHAHLGTIICGDQIRMITYIFDKLSVSSKVA